MHNLPEFPNGIFLGYQLKKADVKAEQYLNKTHFWQLKKKTSIMKLLNIM